MNNDSFKAAAKAVQLSPDALEVIQNAVNNYSGDVNILESAIGAYVMAHFFGYAPLRVMHSPPTMKKWAAILGIDWTEAFPAEGPIAGRSNGYQFALKLNAVADAIRGHASVDNRREILTVAK